MRRPLGVPVSSPGLIAGLADEIGRSPFLTGRSGRWGDVGAVGDVGRPGASGRKAGVQTGERAGRRVRWPARAFCSWRRPSCLVRGAEGDLHFSASPSATVEPLVAADWGRGPFSVARDPLYSPVDARVGPVPVGHSPTSRLFLG